MIRRRFRGGTSMALVSVAFLVLYGSTLLIRGPLDPQNQLFPFLRWDLFSRVPPAVEVNYRVRFVEVDGKPRFVPVYFDEAVGIVASPSSPVAINMMHSLGRATEAGNVRLANQLEAQLESNYMQRLRSARYEVVRREFDIVERYRCDCFRSETVVATLELSRGG